ncbi:MAG: hypothetical protein HQL68_01420 [Magnetococcales bacterium]|nr:hypothetical protein [Magnetococcales bacterium]
MLNSIQNIGAVTHQTSAVSQAIKEAKPNVGTKQTDSQSTKNSGHSFSGSSGFKPPAKGIDISA